MFAKILHTLSSRVGAAGLNFLIVMLTAQFLGAAGRGEISIFIANITFILLFTSLVGGTALVYLTPRVNIYQLLVPAYVWSVLICAIGTFVLSTTGQSPINYAIHLFILSLLQAFFSINTTVLLGKEKVKTNNYLTFLQTFFTLTILLVGFLQFKQQTVTFYFTALYVAYGLTFLLSTFALLRLPDRPDFTGFKKQLPELFRFGSVAQFSNILTFLNYRLGYYFLNAWAGLEAVGVFSIGVSLSEAIWMVGRSLAVVQYAKLVNSDNPQEARKLTIELTKLSFITTLAAVFILAILPPEFLKLLFGKEFGAVKPVIWALSAGVVATGTGMIFSHYFAGHGKYYINNWAAFCGLVLTVPACWFLIPKFGPVGAGIASTLSYLAAFIFLLLKFRRETDFRLTQLFPTRSDLLYLKRLFSKTQDFQAKKKAN